MRCIRGHKMYYGKYCTLCEIDNEQIAIMDFSGGITND